MITETILPQIQYYHLLSSTIIYYHLLSSTIIYYYLLSKSSIFILSHKRFHVAECSDCEVAIGVLGAEFGMISNSYLSISGVCNCGVMPE